MRNYARKTMRDRLMWILARMMTPLFQTVDARKGDTLTLTLQYTRFITPKDPEEVEGEKTESLTYFWNLEENIDLLESRTEVHKLNPDNMELEKISSRSEEIDMDVFFNERSKAGGWSTGRRPGNPTRSTRPAVIDQRGMSPEELSEL